MDRESFLDTVRKQYAEEIRSAYLECEHEGKVDYSELNKSLKKLSRSAKIEGLPGPDFEDLVKSTLPDLKVNFALKAA